MTRAENILKVGLEDSVVFLGFLESTLRQSELAPLAEIVAKYRNKAAAAIDLAERDIQARTERKLPK